MYNIIVASLVAGIGAQILKLIIEFFKGEFSWRKVMVYGGMPSSHAAFVGALVAGVGIREGFDSSTFAIALVFAILIIRDAVGLRRHVGYHGAAIAKLINERKDKNEFPPTINRLGHTPSQALAGLIFGIIIALLFA